MSYRRETRHKAIVIPTTKSVDGVHRFLTVRDSRHQEWIFVTGGCKKSEVDNPLKCGLRELEEETRGVLSFKTGTYTYFNFKSNYRSPDELRKDNFERITVTLEYHVYIIFVTISPEQQTEIINCFNSNKRCMENNKKEGLRIKRAYDENDEMSFDTLDEFNQKRRWKLIVNNIIHNPDFYDALTSTNIKSFNIQTM
jgi:8-oxo-dGTP pyrophosphatase MutT (NUDIX family)